MNNIDTQTEKIKKSGKLGLMTHVVVGYPSLKSTEYLIEVLVQGGSDFIELQIPFSDPLADGPLIMQANEEALKQHIHMREVFKLLKKCKMKYKIPFLLMGYFNSIYSYGVMQFCKDASKAGASGLIIPDIPPEEEKYERFFHYCLENNLYPIRVLSPASTQKRIMINSYLAKGFLYIVRGYGVTGSSVKLDRRFNKFIEGIRKNIKLPLAMGFGISTKKQISALKGIADIVVVGSAVIELIIKQGINLDFKFIERYVRSLKEDR